LPQQRLLALVGQIDFGGARSAQRESSVVSTGSMAARL
jgi:hypothetical protein